MESRPADMHFGPTCLDGAKPMTRTVYFGRLLKKVVDPVAGALGSVWVMDDAKKTQSRERQRPSPDLSFNSPLRTGLGDADFQLANSVQ